MRTPPSSSRSLLALFTAGALAAAGGVALWSLGPAAGPGPAGPPGAVGPGGTLLALVIMLGGAGLLVALLVARELLGLPPRTPGR